MAEFDLFVIGGGSGGVRAARLAAESGARVALAEADRVGGTCVIRGCVPKKLMVAAADYATHLEDASGFGWSIGAAAFDWRRFKAAKDREIARLEANYRSALAKAGVTVIDSRAEPVESHVVRISDGREIEARHILIAVGGAPVIPDLVGRDLASTSDDMFELDHLPDRVAVLGGGYIACEFAGILTGLGCQVTQCYRGDQVLRGFDDEVRHHVAEAMVARGTALRLGTQISSLRRAEDGIEAEFCDGAREVFGLVLAATGRRPRSEELNLPDIGVRTGPNGAIEVNEYSQTSVPSIFAIGDVTNRLNLTPAAIREAVAFVDTVFHGRPQPVDHGSAPTAVFTRPEIGTAGLTEEQASKRGPLHIYTVRFRPLANAIAGRDERMLMKLVVCRATDQVLGAHLVGDGAAEMIQLAAIAIEMGARKADFDRTLAVHPTAAEELVTMREPVRST